jgi:hypothetical protein
MASPTTGYFDSTTTSHGWYARLEYSYTQSKTATVVSLVLKVYNGTKPAYNNNANSAYYEIMGSRTYATYSWQDISMKTVGSHQFTVPAGQTSIDLSAKWVSDVSSTYTPASLSVSGTITVPEIIIETLSVSSIPSTMNKTEGDTITFTVYASGGSNYAYQWYFVSAIGTAIIQNATSSTYSRVVSMSDNGCSIYCKVTSGGNTVRTNQCLLTVSEKAIVIPLNLMQINTVNGFGIFVPMIYQNGKWVNCRWQIQPASEVSSVADIAIADIAIAT